MNAEEFMLPSGETVSIRGLTGYETLLSQKLHKRDELALNTFMLACAMGIAEADALEWLKTHLAGDFMSLAERVQVLSGVGPDAQKSGVAAIRDGAGTGVPVLPGDEAGHDGGPAAEGDA